MSFSFGSVCSGIEAASVAWIPIGGKASWLSEIDKFPSEVLKHHYPDVDNLGDMTTIAQKVLSEKIKAPMVLVGGTPCQSFSVAGMRKGLSDERGALTISFVELANAIDVVRGRKNKKESVIVWENVPGVLSSKDNAFGCFLGALAGESSKLIPPGGGGGRTRVVCMDPKEQSRGGCSMPNISGWPNDASVCLLSQVLEKGSTPPKYYLSSKACEGMFRRLSKAKKPCNKDWLDALIEQSQTIES